MGAVYHPSKQRDKASNTISSSRDSAYTCHAVRRRLNTRRGAATVHRDLNGMALAPYGDREFFREAQPPGPCSGPRATTCAARPGRERPIRSARCQIQPPPEILASGTRSGGQVVGLSAARSSTHTPLGRRVEGLRHSPEEVTSFVEATALRQVPAPISDRHMPCPATSSNILNPHAPLADNLHTCAHQTAPGWCAALPTTHHTYTPSRWLRGRCADAEHEPSGGGRSPSARKAQRAEAGRGAARTATGTLPTGPAGHWPPLDKRVAEVAATASVVSGGREDGREKGYAGRVFGSPVMPIDPEGRTVTGWTRRRIIGPRALVFH
nr:unnamed protein product [Digitaria exilis]